MKKTAAIALIVIATAIIAAALSEALPEASDENIMVVWTRAICNSDNYCIDIKITCVNGELVAIEPVAEGIYFPVNWNDNRPEEITSQWC